MKRKKNLLATLFTSFLITSTSISAFGAQGVVKDGRTLIPVRGVFEDLGFIVDWDSSTSTATIYDSSHEVSISKNNSYFLADGNEYSLDVPAQIIDGSMYIPLRAVGEAVGADVSWISDAKQAHIRYGEHDIYVVCSNPKQTATTNSTSQSNKPTTSQKKYAGTNIPDIGAIFGIKPIDTDYGSQTHVYITYSMNDLISKIEFTDLNDMILQHGNTLYDIKEENEGEYNYYFIDTSTNHLFLICYDFNRNKIDVIYFKPQ